MKNHKLRSFRSILDILEIVNLDHSLPHILIKWFKSIHALSSNCPLYLGLFFKFFSCLLIFFCNLYIDFAWFIYCYFLQIYLENYESNEISDNELKTQLSNCCFARIVGKLLPLSYYSFSSQESGEGDESCIRALKLVAKTRDLKM